MHFVRRPGFLRAVGALLGLAGMSNMIGLPSETRMRQLSGKKSKADKQRSRPWRAHRMYRHQQGWSHEKPSQSESRTA